MISSVWNRLMRVGDAPISLGIYLPAFVALVVIHLLTLTTSAVDYEGFHGLSLQGRLPSTGTHRNALIADQQNVKWQIPLQGMGFSSPIVHNGFCYTTFADQVRQYPLAASGVWVILATFSLVLVRYTWVECASLMNVLNVPWRRSLASVTSFLIAICFSLLLFLAPEMVATDSSLHRNWKFGSLLGILPMLFAASRSLGTRSAVYVTTLLAALYAVAAYSLMPRKELLFTLSTSDGFKSTLILLAPPLCCALLAFYGVQTTTDTSANKHRSDLQRVGLSVIALLIVVLGVRALIHISIGGLTFDLRALVRPVGFWSASLGWFACVLCCMCFRDWRSRGLRTLCTPRWENGVCFALGLLALLLQGVLLVLRTNTFSVECVRVSDGSQVWIRQVKSITNLRDFKERNTLASSTPIFLGDRIIAFFGSAGLFAVSPEGKVLWSRTDITNVTTFGTGVSVTGANALAVVLNDCEKAPGDVESARSEIVALRVDDGSTAWRIPRTIAKAGFATPIVRNYNGTQVVIVRDWENVSGYDLANGVELWNYQMRYRGSHLVASLITDDDVLIACDATRVVALSIQQLASRVSPILWSTAMPGEKASTPLVAGGLVFGITENGQAYCIDRASGDLKWKHKLADRFFASPISGGDHVLFVGQGGSIWIVDASDRFLVIARGRVPKGVYSSPVPQHDGVIIRSENALTFLSMKLVATGG